VLPSTAKDIAKELGYTKYDLKDPETNRIFGEYYLKKLITQFDGDLELALTAYHSGPGRVENLLKIHDASTFKEIRKHLGPVGQKYAPEIIARIKKSSKNLTA
jgi:soluble lytic murein transglycosylase-like protein